MYGNQIVDLFGTGFPDWRDRLGARALPARRRRRADRRLRALPAAATGRRGLMDVALSRRARGCCGRSSPSSSSSSTRRSSILLIFSFNDSALPTFPLSGFTLHWYHQFLDERRSPGALETSAIVAALSSVGAVVLGVLASIALVRRPLPGEAGPVSALLLSPLVIPYVVFGISLAAPLPRARGPRWAPDRGDRSHRDHACRTRSSC